MKIMNATLMMTVEHTVVAKTRSSPQDAVNVWMEYDVATHEAYVCLREMSNWDGLHTGIHVVSTYIPPVAMQIHITFERRHVVYVQAYTLFYLSIYAVCRVKPAIGNP